MKQLSVLRISHEEAPDVDSSIIGNHIFDICLNGVFWFLRRMFSAQHEKQESLHGKRYLKSLGGPHWVNTWHELGLRYGLSVSVIQPCG